MPLADGLYIVSGHHEGTQGLANENRWVGVKIEDSFAEWLQLEGPKAQLAAEAASDNPVLETCVGTGAVAMGTPMGMAGKRMETLKQQKEGAKSKKKDDEEGQVILGDLEESLSYEDRLFNRVTKTITDSLQRRRQFCVRCRCDRTFAESEGDKMRCIVCAHTLYRADSHFSVIKGKGMYSPPASKKAIKESPWEPGEDLPESIIEMMDGMDPQMVADMAVKAKEGPTAATDREAKLKQKAEQKTDDMAEKRKAGEQAKEIKKELENTGGATPV